MSLNGLNDKNNLIVLAIIFLPSDDWFNNHPIPLQNPRFRVLQLLP